MRHNHFNAKVLPMAQNVFVNRTLNLKKIKYLGFDMDHTLIRYDSEAFERLSYQIILDKLVHTKGYPPEILQLQFDFNLAIRGLTIDRNLGNILKLNRHNAIRTSYHGLNLIEFKSQQKLYKSIYIDLNDPHYYSVDTAFAISHATLFMQLVDLKNRQESHKAQLAQGLQPKNGAGDCGEKGIPEYAILADDIMECLDTAHRDDSLKRVVQADLAKYIHKDPLLVEGLERFKRHDKKLFLLTNSDYGYTKTLLDFAITPYLKEHSHWSELFEIVITVAQKPRFFNDTLKFLRVDPQTGSMRNYDQKLTPGIYQGGCAKTFTKDLQLNGDDVLYVGDHIYGDILRLKKACNWRTALVVEELAEEIKNNKKAQPFVQQIEALMALKEPIEERYTELNTQKFEKNGNVKENEISSLIKQINDYDQQVSDLIKEQQKYYNPRWGAVMRVGNEESHFAYQVERYACIYMAQLVDLLTLSPRTYFRANRRPLAHEDF